MEESRLTVRVEHIPAHKYLGIWEERATNYGEFWENHDCDEVCGFVTSMDKMAHPIVTAHTAGWNKSNGKNVYFYGTGIEMDYSVFSYPTFYFLKENCDVIDAVEKLAWSFDPSIMGYEWNEEVNQDYQRHYPEKLGYQVLRPVKKMNS